MIKEAFTMENELLENSNFIMYTTDDGQVEIEVRLEDENVWITQKAMSELFDTTKQNISLHINNIFEENELNSDSVVKENLTTAQDGKKYKTKFYNLDLIIAVGYRVKSIRGTQFRIWANKLIREYLIKGYNLNVNRFKNNGSNVYFEEIRRYLRFVDVFFFCLLRNCITRAILTHHKGGFSSSRLGNACKHSLLSLRIVG